MKRSGRRLHTPVLLGLLAIASVVLAACSGASDTQRLIAPASDLRTEIARIALERIGSPYQAAGSGPDRFDDPGLAYYAYREAGATLPRNRDAQLDSGKPIDLSQARPADLLFYRVENERGDDRLLVGLYTRSGEMVMAAPPITNGEPGVQRFDTDDAFWSQRLVGVIQQIQ